MRDHAETQTDEQLLALMDRYLLGEASPDEVDALRRSSGDASLVRLQQLRETLEVPWPGAISAEARLRQLHQRVQPERHSASRPVPQTFKAQQFGARSHAWYGRLWFTAAALIFAFAVGVIGWRAGIHHTRLASSPLTYTTANGERANVTLPDGSTVSLDVASRLEVPADYASGDHTVRLTGAGLFTVIHSGRAPFTVLVGTTRAHVLGTSFVARHYTSDSATTVAVRDGKVAVGATVVTAARMAVVRRRGPTRLLSADPATFSFASGVLVLDGGLLPDVIPDLNRWYDVDIRLGDARLATQRMTAKLSAGSVAELSDILQRTFDVRVVRDGRVLTLFARS